MSAETVAEVLVMAAGVALMATGTVRKGRALRPLSAPRARAASERHHTRLLRRAAGLAIAAARRAAGDGEPVVVTVEDVMRVADEHFGHTVVDRPGAAAALRHAYERGACAADCVTDAYG
ncbi:hypothetical protein [Streptomyces vilmorinianum]|uniref:hypothetical protein n=1 Tax=Streptomyces vilmorinianum TaxID=3051092 RepID=UPI0020C7AAFF|nr:hypothetical protein [Streptomyces vilmorinianum]